MSNPPRPTVLKQLEGTVRKDRTNNLEPRSPALSVGVAPPSWIKTADAKRAWKALIDVSPPGLVTQMDAAALGLLVNAFGDYLEARRVIAKEGRYYWQHTEMNGSVQRVHPAVKVEESAFAKVRAFLKDFGMTPVDRTRVHVPQHEDVDPTDLFLQSGAVG